MIYDSRANQKILDHHTEIHTAPSRHTEDLADVQYFSIAVKSKSF